AAIPGSQSLAGLRESYFEHGWYRNDYRERGAARMLVQGYMTDQDVISRDEMKRHPYWQEHLAPNGFEWFLGLPLTAGHETWVATIQRSPAQGPFQMEEIRQ